MDKDLEEKLQKTENRRFDPPPPPPPFLIKNKFNWKERDFIPSDGSDFSKVWKSCSVSVKSVVELVSIAIVFLKNRLAVHLSS